LRIVVGALVWTLGVVGGDDADPAVAVGTTVVLIPPVATELPPPPSTPVTTSPSTTSEHDQPEHDQHQHVHHQHVQHQHDDQHHHLDDHLTTSTTVPVPAVGRRTGGRDRRVHRPVHVR
jgi:hypothetical protein